MYRPCQAACACALQAKPVSTSRIVHSHGVAEMSDAEKIEIIRQILAEPAPEWFQNAHRRANSYAEQLRRIAAAIEPPSR